MLPAAKCCTTSKRGRMRENLTALIKLLGLSLLLCGREMGDKTYIIYTDKHEKHWRLWFVTDKGQKRRFFKIVVDINDTDLISLNLNDLVLTSANFLGVTRLVVPGFVTLSLSLVLFEFCMFKHQMPRYGLAVIHLKSRSAMQQGCISQSPLLSALTLAQRLCAARGCDYTSFQFGVLHQKHHNFKSPPVGAPRGRYCRCNTRTWSDLLIEA